MRTPILMAALLFASAAFAETNVPVTCSLASAEGKERSACSGSAYRFNLAQPATLVRICRGKQFCTEAERLWARLDSAAPASDWIMVCGVEKAPGSAITECKGTAGTQWGALRMVKPADVARAVEAEPPPADAFPGTFTVSPESGDAPLSVAITWDLSAFVGGSCTASGSWTGTKALKGTQSATNLTADASYTLSCARSIPGSGEATPEWTTPSENTNGSALTTLAGFRILYGLSESALTQTVQVASPSATEYTVTNLDAATWYFAVRAYNSAGSESAPSNVLSKAVSLRQQSVSATRSVAVAPPPTPKPPVLQTVASQVFDAVPDYSILAFRASVPYGTAPLGTPCDEARPIHGSYFPVPAGAVAWDSSRHTDYPVALCSKAERETQ